MTTRMQRTSVELFAGAKVCVHSYIMEFVKDGAFWCRLFWATRSSATVDSGSRLFSDVGD